jgi:hypothetical protein
MATRWQSDERTSDWGGDGQDLARRHFHWVGHSRQECRWDLMERGIEISYSETQGRSAGKSLAKTQKASVKTLALFVKFTFVALEINKYAFCSQ